MRPSSISTILSIIVSSFVASTAYAQDAQPPAGDTANSGATETAPPIPDQPASTAEAPGMAPQVQAPGEAPPAAAAPAEEPKPKPPPYSPPFKLRPVVPLNVVLIDSALAKYENAAGQGGLTYVQTLLGAYKVTKELNVLARVGFVQDSAPSAPGAPTTDSGAAFMNPVLGGAYNTKVGDFRIGGFLGVALPFGGGGGDGTGLNRFAKNARVKGIPARASMDNAMFAVNDFVVFPGVGLAYVNHGWTIQVEATVLELLRARGEKDQPEKTKTNFTSGLHVGYFIVPQLSLGAELHYQRWLNAPLAVEAAEKVDENARTYAQKMTAGGRDQATFQVGPRAHFKVGDVWIRPAIAYERGVDFPMASAALNYHNVQLHIPIIFP